MIKDARIIVPMLSPIRALTLRAVRHKRLYGAPVGSCASLRLSLALAHPRCRARSAAGCPSFNPLREDRQSEHHHDHNRQSC